MASNIRNPFEQGPYVQVAAFCDQVIKDETGVFSLIRVIDTVTQTAAGPDAPAEMPPLTYRVKLVLMLKSGRARGRHEIKVIAVEMGNSGSNGAILAAFKARPPGRRQ